MMNKQIKEIWEGDAAGYNFGVRKELNSTDSEKWADLILSFAPHSGTLDILDCGTGPGFFPVILGKRGHHVTGIDLAENMIKEAKENLEREGLPADLRVMDCQQTTFKDHSFDLIISRNITWTLCDPEKAYKEWLRILKPGGRMLIMDANYYLHLYDESRMKIFEELNQLMIKNQGRGIYAHNGDEDTFADLGLHLFMSDKNRPAWDLGYMISLNVKRVFAIPDIDRELGRNKNLDDLSKAIQEFTPMFLVGCEKI